MIFLICIIVFDIFSGNLLQEQEIKEMRLDYKVIKNNLIV